MNKLLLLGQWRYVKKSLKTLACNITTASMYAQYAALETRPKQWWTSEFKSMQTKSASKHFRFFLVSHEFPIFAHFESKVTILNASGYVFRKNGQNPEIPIFSLLLFYHLHIAHLVKLPIQVIEFSAKNAMFQQFFY